jgi:hypothetical protein
MDIIMDKLKVINKENNKNMGKGFIILEMVLFIKVFNAILFRVMV